MNIWHYFFTFNIPWSIAVITCLLSLVIAVFSSQLVVHYLLSHPVDTDLDDSLSTELNHGSSSRFSNCITAHSWTPIGCFGQACETTNNQRITTNIVFAYCEGCLYYTYRKGSTMLSVARRNRHNKQPLLWSLDIDLLTVGSSIYLGHSCGQHTATPDMYATCQVGWSSPQAV